MTREQIEKRFGAKFTDGEDYAPGRKVSAFGLPSVPVICSGNPDEISLLTWGLVPSWIKNEESARSIRMKTFNARSETLAEKPSFRNAFRDKRCMVLVNGFYEWQHAGKKKIPYFIRLRDDIPFALAGLYDNWINRDTGEVLNTFTIITTPANPMMEIIHNTKKRMPAILSPDAEREWLNAGYDSRRLAEFLKPFDENLMLAEKVA